MQAFGSGRSLSGIIENLKNGKIQKVVVLVGAGVSCSAGIPDFRSPGGMYDSLRPELLTATAAQKAFLKVDPSAVVHVDLFRVNQFPYMEVRRPFILGTAERKWKPTLSHFFIKLLEDKNLLQRVYTQNIDGLEYHTDLCEDKIVAMHGSLGRVQCEFCGTPYDINKFRCEVEKCIKNIYDPSDSESPIESSPILCEKCNRAGVKPATVMYGSMLPDVVWNRTRQDFPNNVDLMIVAGTSLTVSPACDLVTRVQAGVSRLVVNREKVGEHLGLDFALNSHGSSAGNGQLDNVCGSGSDSSVSSSSGDRFGDVLLAGDCDEGFLSLARDLGWLGELHAYRDRMCVASSQILQSAISGYCS